MKFSTALNIGAGVVFVGILFHFQRQIAEKDAFLREKDALLREKDALLLDPYHGKKVAIEAFNKAELWRQQQVASIYEGVTDAELDAASRWATYARPFSAERSCGHNTSERFLSAVDTIVEIVASSAYGAVSWTEQRRRAYLSLHAFHSTGIEGNTLSLPETALVINNQSLFSGFKEDFATPVTQTSIKEVRNIQHLVDALKLSDPLVPPVRWQDLNSQSLVDMNAAILRGISAETEAGGFRRHPVAIGHQHVVLPMPDEVPQLMAQFLALLNGRVKGILDAGPEEDIAARAVALACDAHTTFVHIHPFPDGNGRLARIISGIVLQTFGLPMAMFTKEDRNQYIGDVGNAVVRMKYNGLCERHADAIILSLRTIMDLP